MMGGSAVLGGKVASQKIRRRREGAPLPFSLFCAVLFPIVLSSSFAVDFAKDVRPILERSCLGCHGPEKQKSGYRLDVREIALRGGDNVDGSFAG